MDADKIKQDIKEILNRYLFEVNTEKTRNQICNDLSVYLNRNVIDKTTPEMVQNQQFDFRVKVNGTYIKLDEYLSMIVLIERKEKIDKILNGF